MSFHGIGPSTVKYAGQGAACAISRVGTRLAEAALSMTRSLLSLLALFTLTACSGDASGGAVELLHVSYDPTRELFAEVNEGFSAQWAREHDGQELVVRMSHGGSGAQARAVIDGLDADLVSLALPYDVDAIAREGATSREWARRLPNDSSPWYSTIVFVVRRGNPRGVRDWPDLLRGETRVITPSPKTSGGARWTYLAAYGYAARHGYDGQTGDEAGAAFVRALYQRVPVLDSGARGASNTFAQNGIGDVLLTWENEAHLLREEMASAGLEIVIPTESILAEPPVALVDRNVERHGTGAAAEAYARHLWSAEVQEIAARRHYRPREEAVLERHRASFPTLTLFTVADQFGASWDELHRRHFADGALFDQVQRRGGAR